MTQASREWEESSEDLVGLVPIPKGPKGCSKYYKKPKAKFHTITKANSKD